MKPQSLEPENALPKSWDRTLLGAVCPHVLEENRGLGFTVGLT